MYTSFCSGKRPKVPSFLLQCHLLNSNNCSSLNVWKLLSLSFFLSFFLSFCHSFFSLSLFSLLSLSLSSLSFSFSPVPFIGAIKQDGNNSTAKRLETIFSLFLSISFSLQCQPLARLSRTATATSHGTRLSLKWGYPQFRGETLWGWRNFHLSLHMAWWPGPWQRPSFSPLSVTASQVLPDGII